MRAGALRSECPSARAAAPATRVAPTGMGSPALIRGGALLYLSHDQGGILQGVGRHPDAAPRAPVPAIFPVGAGRVRAQGAHLRRAVRLPRIPQDRSAGQGPAGHRAHRDRARPELRLGADYGGARRQAGIRPIEEGQGPGSGLLREVRRPLGEGLGGDVRAGQVAGILRRRPLVWQADPKGLFFIKVSI